MTETNTSTSQSVRRKLLLISYHFPPSPAVGGLRAVNFAKYLSSFSWIPYVLTLECHDANGADGEMPRGMETVKVIRTGQFPTLLLTYLRIKERCSRILQKKVVLPKYGTGQNNSLNLDVVPPETLPEKLKRYVLSLFLALPDTARGWIVPAAVRAVRTIRQDKINYMLTSSPPYSVHLIGILVKIMTRVRWIADFRDPWMNGGTKLEPTCVLSNKIESWLEKKVVHGADLVMFNTQRLRDLYRSIYSTEPERKFIYIPNGIDQTTFSKTMHLKTYQRFTLSYTGSLYVDRSPEPIFKAVQELLVEGKVCAEEINIKLVGHCHYISGRPISPFIDAYGLKQIVEVLGPVSRVKALEIVERSHLALVFAPNQPFQIPAKVYDYIGTGTRILAIAENSATADLIQSSNAGKVFVPTDIQGIKEYILETMTTQPAIGKKYSPEAIYKYDARRLTETLVQNMNRILGDGNTGSSAME